MRRKTDRKMRFFSDEEKKAIIADVQEGKNQTPKIGVVETLEKHNLQTSVYYSWVKKFGIGSPSTITTTEATETKRKGRKPGSKNKKTTLLEMPMQPTFTAPPANVAMFFGSPESLKAIYADLMGGGA